MHREAKKSTRGHTASRRDLADPWPSLPGPHPAGCSHPSEQPPSPHPQTSKVPQSTRRKSCWSGLGGSWGKEESLCGENLSGAFWGRLPREIILLLSLSSTLPRARSCLLQREQPSMGVRRPDSHTGSSTDQLCKL